MKRKVMKAKTILTSKNDYHNAGQTKEKDVKSIESN